MFDFFKLRDSVQGLGQQLQTIRTDIQATLQQIEDVTTAPSHPDDIMAVATKWIKEKEAKYQDIFSKRIFASFVKSADILERDEFEREHLRYLNVAFDSTEVVLIGMVGADRIIDIFQEHANKMTPENHGPRNSERGAIFEKLQKKLGKLRNEEAKIINGAAEAGLSIH